MRGLLLRKFVGRSAAPRVCCKFQPLHTALCSTLVAYAVSLQRTHCILCTSECERYGGQCMRLSTARICVHACWTGWPGQAACL